MNHKYKFKLLYQIINIFIKKKKWKEKHFLNKLQNKLKYNNIHLSNKRLINLIYILYKYNHFFNKIDSIKSKIIYEINIQSGGFLYNNHDNKYIKAFSIIDFLIDIYNLIPNKLLSHNNNIISTPFNFISIFINLLRGEYDYAFYNMIGLIPGIGSIMSSSIKIVHRIIRYIINYYKIQDIEEYYKQIQAVRRVHDFVKDERWEKLQNPFIGKFEDNYNINKIDEEFLK